MRLFLLSCALAIAAVSIVAIMQPIRVTPAGEFYLLAGGFIPRWVPYAALMGAAVVAALTMIAWRRQ